MDINTMKKEVTLIYNIHKEDDYISVIAVVEDSRLVYSRNSVDPPEYGPGICIASFYLNEDEILPEDDDELLDYINELNLDWEIYDEYNDY